MCGGLGEGNSYQRWWGACGYEVLRRAQDNKASDEVSHKNISAAESPAFVCGASKTDNDPVLTSFVEVADSYRAEPAVVVSASAVAWAFAEWGAWRVLLPQEPWRAVARTGHWASC